MTLNTSDQPAPRPGGEPVTPVAREWFAQVSLQQHEKGLGKYGTELLADGVDAMDHLGQELVDAVHYFTKERLWKAEVMLSLQRWLICRDVHGSILADDPAGVEEAAAGLQAATDALDRVARRCVG